ncbi:MAG: thioesterase [Rhodobacteraceae bacterium]|nr:thioesterase [Paracoccaceae bacterium]
MMPFEYTITVKPEWIDYNGHMQDAYYGLVFSYAVDAFQDWVGFDAAYRTATDCTIYLVEEHKYFLREVKESDPLAVQISVLGVSQKVFHLHCVMQSGGHDVAISELMEMHVCQKPTPKGAPIPHDIVARLNELITSDTQKSQIARRARAMRITS